MAQVVDTIFLALGLKTDGLENGLAKAQAKLTGGIAGILKGLAAPLTAGLSVGAIYSGLKNLTAQMGAFSAATGVSVEDATAWSRAAVMMGGTTEGFQGNLERLNMQMARIATTGRSRMLPFFESLGVAVTDDEGKARPVLDVFMDISKAIEGMPKPQSRGILMNMGFDSATIKLLQSGSDNIQNLVEREREYGTVSADTVKNMKAMNLAIKDLSYGIMMLFMPAFSGLMKISANVFKFLKFGFDTLRQNIQVVKGIATVLVVIFSAKLVRAVQLFWATLMKNPIMMVVAAIGMMILVLEDLWVYATGGQSALPGLWRKMFGSPEQARAAIVKFGETFMKVMTAVGDFMDGAGGKILSVLKVIVELLVDFLSTLTGQATAAGIAVGLSFVKIASFASKAIPAVKDFFAGFKIISRVMSVVRGFIAVLRVLRIALLALTMAGPWALLVVAVLMAIALIITHWGEVRQFLVDTFSAIAEWFSEKMSDIAAWWNGVCESIGQWWGGVCQSIMDMWNSAVDAISAGVDAVYNFFANLGQGIYDALAWVFDWISDKWNTVTSMLPSLDSIGQKINATANGMAQTLGIGGGGGPRLGNSFYGGTYRNSNVVVGEVKVYPKGNNFATNPGDVRKGFAPLIDGGTIQ